MRIYWEENRSAIAGSSLALGMFDGVHLGHRAVIKKAVSLAREDKLRACVYTFSNHPLAILGEGKEPLRLQSVEERLEIFRDLGVDEVLMLPFTAEYAARSPEQFARVVLTARHLVMGENYSFGTGGRGNAALLEKLARGGKCQVHVQPLVLLDGQPVSSSRIRQCLANGDREKAEKMLGTSVSAYAWQRIEKS